MKPAKVQTLRFLSGLIVSVLASGWLLAATGPAKAETTGLATSSAGGAVHNMGVSIASVASAKGMDLRVTPFKSTTQAIPLVASDEIRFGLANAYELKMAHTGTVVFDGRPIKGIRLVAALYPFKMGLMVRTDSGIESMDGLRGKRLPSGFGATATGELLISGMLAASGLSYDDVEPVKVSSFGNMRKEFLSGRIDAMIGIVGSGRDVRISETVGGVRVLGIPSSDEAQDRLRQFVPVARAEPVLAADKIVGVEADMHTVAYDYYLYTTATADEQTVATLLDAVIEERDALTKTIPAFRWFDLKRVGTDIGIPFHPAVATVLKKRGLAD